METPIAAPATEAPTSAAPEGQQFAGGGQPLPQEGAQSQSGPTAPVETQPQEPQYFLKAGTGTVYLTPEAAVAGIEEKDRFIQQLLSDRGQPVQQTAPQAQPDPQAQRAAAIGEIQRDLEIQYASDPDFSGYSPADIKAEAKIQAIAAYNLHQKITASQQQQAQVSKFEAMVANTPDLQTPLASEVYERALQNGYKFANPQQHLDAVHAEMFRRGMTPSHPQGGYQGVHSAAAGAATGQRIFNTAPGSQAQAPQAVVLSERGREQIAFAERQGFTGEALENIRRRVMESEGARR